MCASSATGSVSLKETFASTPNKYLQAKLCRCLLAPEFTFCGKIWIFFYVQSDTKPREKEARPNVLEIRGVA